jgi:SAM-dependent methyltransferase
MIAGSSARSFSIARNRAREYIRRLGGGGILLEVGAGVGVLSRGLAESGFKYLGIDVDTRVVAEANRRGNNVELADFLDFDPTQRFDAVVASQVFEHFLQPVDFTEKANQLLKPGGLLHIDIPNHYCLAGMASRYYVFPRSRRRGAIEPPHHLMGYSEGSLRLALSKMTQVEIFRSTASDRTWGQAGRIGHTARAYGAISRLVGREGILVAIARKPTRDAN